MGQAVSSLEVTYALVEAFTDKPRAWGCSGHCGAGQGGPLGNKTQLALCGFFFSLLRLLSIMLFPNLRDSTLPLWVVLGEQLLLGSA